MRVIFFLRVIFDRRGDFRIQVGFRTPKMGNLCSWSQCGNCHSHSVWEACELPKERTLESSFQALGRPFPLTLLFPEGNNDFSHTGKVSLSFSHSVKSRIKHGKQKITERGTRSVRQANHQFKTLAGGFGSCELEGCYHSSSKTMYSI